MGKSWNPNAPAVLGPEPTPTNGADSGIQAWIVRDLIMASTQAETVTGFGIPIKDNAASNGGRPHTWIEVHEAGNELIGGNSALWTLNVYQPNADAAGSMIGAADWNSQPGGGFVNLWSFIDDPVVWPPAVPQDRIATASGPDVYHFHVNSGAFPLTRRIIRMGLRVVLAAEEIGGGGYSNRNFALGIYRISDGQSRRMLQSQQLWATGYTTYFSIDMGEVNPFTGLPWTPLDVRAFDAGDYAMRIEAVGTATTWAVVYAAELAVTHMEENREAVALWARPDGQASATVATTACIALPAATANWAKPASGDFAYRWRIPNDLFFVNPVSWPTTAWRTALTRIDPNVIEGLPHGTRAQIVGTDPNGLTAITLPDFLPNVFPSDAVPALYLTVAGNASSDSQPYYCEPSTLTVPGPTVLANATSTLAQGQRMTPGATATYLGVRFVVAAPDDADATLTVTVHRVSDGVQMGGSLVLTQAEVLALPAIEESTAWRQVQGFLSSGAALVSGTAYEVRLAPAGGGIWSFPRLLATNEGDISFGGTAGCRVTRTLPGLALTSFPNEDLGVVLLEQPPSVASAVAAVLATPTRQGVSCFCAVEAVDNVVVTWIPNAVSAFARIEFERYLDTGDWEASTWHPVAWKLSNPNADVAKWTDYEVPRGMPVKYRLRYVNTVGAWSAWVETEFVTPQARGSEIVFASNEAPDIMVVYQHEPSASHGLLGFDEDVLMPVDGADYQLAFVGTEDRGISDRRRIIVNFGRQPCDDIGRPIGRQRLFLPLRNAVRRGGLPYVCVLDSDGNRTFAHVALDDATSDMPGWRYYTVATVTPVSGTPVVVVVP